MHFTDTEHYTLGDLFGNGSVTFVIPDFQRDYCWGDKVYGVKGDNDIVSGFLLTLKSEFDTAAEEEFFHQSFLGKADFYHYEGDFNHLYLTDGQQRLTTLYLLIGILYKYTKHPALEICLNTTDGRLTLEYAVRETSINFLKDLVTYYFSDPSTDVTKLTGQTWFFNEYKLDPTINSIILALGVIDKFVKALNDKIDSFASFLLHHVEIQYYDGGGRRESEERFVIINTTGESLTESENIKPLLLGRAGDPSYALQWEARETWFWKRRLPAEISADPGVNNFLGWCFRISGPSQQPDLIRNAKAILKRGTKASGQQLTFTDDIFRALQALLELLAQEEVQAEFKYVNNETPVRNLTDLRKLTDERQFHMLLPVLAFIRKYGAGESALVSFMRRLRKNYYHQTRAERQTEYTDWKDIIKIIDQSSDANCAMTAAHVRWYNEEERFKDELRQEGGTEANAHIRIWEDHPDFMGYLTPLFRITNYTKNISTLINYFQAYVDFNKPERQVRNEIALIRIFADTAPGWFGVDGLGYRCAQNNPFSRIFTKPWFDTVWKFFTEDPRARFENLRIFNNNALNSMIRNKYFSDDLLLTNNKASTAPVTMDMIKAFEYERVKNHYWAEGYIIASVYYWFYLENLYDRDQDLTASAGQPQIGIQLRLANGLPDELLYNYANLRAVTHAPRGWYTEAPYSLMKVTNATYGDSQDIAGVDNTIMSLRKQIAVGDSIP